MTRNKHDRAANRRVTLGWALLLISSVPLQSSDPVFAQSSPPNRISSIRSKLTQYYRHTYGPDRKVDGTRSYTSRQTHYYVRFTEDEGFEFVVPWEMMSGLNATFYSTGATVYWYDDDKHPDTYPIPYPISNHVLSVREALLAAKDFFDKACQKAGLTQTLYAPGEPIAVYFGRTGKPTVLAFANFPRKRMLFRDSRSRSSDQMSSLALHEYFHFVQQAVWYEGDDDPVGAVPNSWLRYSRDSDKQLIHFLFEMSAQWATDEPIQIKDVTAGGTFDQDSVNDYLHYCTAYGFYFRDNEIPFFQRDAYESGVLLKYLAEQIEGGRDASAAPEILAAIAETYRTQQSVTSDNFYSSLVKPLPGESWGASWQEKWARFFSAFCASNIVQKASQANTPAKLLGYHDDAFQQSSSMYRVRTAKIWNTESNKPIARVYKQPAANDEERKRRLATLAEQKLQVPPLSNLIHEIDLRHDREGASSRPVFVLARGEPGTDVFLMRQSYTTPSIQARTVGTRFEWIRDFSLVGEAGPAPTRVGELPDVSFAPESQHIWFGLVNTDPANQPHDMEWSYLASPRLIPYGTDVTSRLQGSSTVLLVGGPGYGRSEAEGLYNGEQFTLEIQSTGPLHRTGTNLSDIPENDLSFQVQVLREEDDAEVQLAADGHKLIAVNAIHRPYGGHKWRYCISGKFAERNPITGDCRFRIRLTSPLNLGGDDEQIDGTFKFRLRERIPSVERVVVSSSGEPVYDSQQFVQASPQPHGDAYRLNLKITFSLPMKHEPTVLLAGLEPPYNSHRVERLSWYQDNKVCHGILEVPKATVSDEGAILRLSIIGQSEADGFIDADYHREGNQPDTSHFVMLGVDSFYDFQLAAQASQECTKIHDAGTERMVVEVAPVGFQLRLVSEAVWKQNNPFRSHYSFRLQWMHKLSRDLQNSVEQLENDFEQFEANPQRKGRQLLKAKKLQLSAMKQQLERFKKQNSPIDLRYLKQAIRNSEQGLDSLKKDRDLGKTLLDEKKKALDRERKRLQFVKRQIPTYEALARVLSGCQWYVYRPSVSGPIRTEFGGVTWTGEGRFKLWSKTLSASAPAWHTPDLVSLGAGRIEDRSFILWTLDFTDKEIADIRRLFQESKQFPGYMRKKHDTPLSSLVQTPLQLQIDAQLPAFPKALSDDCRSAATKLWEFFPPEQRPSSPTAMVPPFSTNHCVKLFVSTRALLSDLPFEISGQRVATYFETGRVEETPISLNATAAWGTANTPPGLQKLEAQIGGTSARFGGSILYADKFDRIDWRIAESSCAQQVDGSFTADGGTHGTGHWLTFYAQPAGPTMSGKLHGQYESEEIASSRTAEAHKWIFQWSLIKGGDTQALRVSGAEAREVPPNAPPVEDPRHGQRPTSASAFDPRTGDTTSSVRNTDGSRTVTVRDEDGNVLSTHVEPSSDQRLPNASVTDPATGQTTTSEKHPDGTTTITRTDGAGNVLSQETLE